jgi:hypothetical protein
MVAAAADFADQAGRLAEPGGDPLTNARQGLVAAQLRRQPQEELTKTNNPAHAITGLLCCAISFQPK